MFPDTLRKVVRLGINSRKRLPLIRTKLTLLFLGSLPRPKEILLRCSLTVAMEMLQQRVTITMLQRHILNLVIKSLVQVHAHKLVRVARNSWFISTPLGIGDGAIDAIAC